MFCIQEAHDPKEILETASIRILDAGKRVCFMLAETINILSSSSIAASQL
jgi:hypothetical protein